MKHYDNIEKHPTKKGYIGYTGEGFARFIEKRKKVDGLWIAYPHVGEGNKAILIFAVNLRAMSAALAASKGTL